MNNIPKITVLSEARVREDVGIPPSSLAVSGEWVEWMAQKLGITTEEALEIGNSWLFNITADLQTYYIRLNGWSCREQAYSSKHHIDFNLPIHRFNSRKEAEEALAENTVNLVAPGEPSVKMLEAASYLRRDDEWSEACKRPVQEGYSIHDLTMKDGDYDFQKTEMGQHVRGVSLRRELTGVETEVTVSKEHVILLEKAPPTKLETQSGVIKGFVDIGIAEHAPATGEENQGHEINVYGEPMHKRLSARRDHPVAMKHPVDNSGDSPAELSVEGDGFGRVLLHMVNKDNVWNPEAYCNRSVVGCFGIESNLTYRYVRGAGYLNGWIGEWKIRIYYSHLQGFQVWRSVVASRLDIEENNTPKTFNPQDAQGVFKYVKDLVCR